MIFISLYFNTNFVNKHLGTLVFQTTQILIIGLKINNRLLREMDSNTSVIKFYIFF